MKIVPINDRLILRPSDSAMRGTLFVPEQYRDGATSCLVLSRGKDVTHYIKTNEYVLCETGFGERQANHFPGTRDFWCKEHNIYAVVRNNIIFPIGKKILIRRDVDDSEINGIIIPENRRYQSLNGTIVRLGLTRDGFKTNGLAPGSKICLKEWNESMICLTLEDGSYGLIVNESDILYKYEG